MKPEPVIIKGDKGDDDQQLVILLMPAGKAIEAVGSHSGVFSRHPHIHYNRGFWEPYRGNFLWSNPSSPLPLHLLTVSLRPETFPLMERYISKGKNLKRQKEK
jgi:hypothetical protein